jgi:hypothetical protein
MNLPSLEMEESNDAGEQKTGKGQEMQTGKGLWETFIVTCQPTKTGQPGDGALDHPAPGQQDEAVFGIGQFDDFQMNALRSGIVGSLLTAVSCSGQDLI